MPYADKAKTRAVSRAHYVANKERANARSKAWDAAHPERRKAIGRDAYRRKRGFAPTRPTPAVCECCGKPPGKRPLCADHCHLTLKFRGWLCNACNTGLGLLNDTPMLAVRYLERAYG